MKRLLTVVVLLAALAAGVYAMAEATQNRPDRDVAGSTTTVRFDVTTRDVHRGEHTAAATLWAVCAATVPGAISGPTGVDGEWEATIEPAIGEHGTRRLTGCLEDVTLDRVIGRVVTMRSSG